MALRQPQHLVYRMCCEFGGSIPLQVPIQKLPALQTAQTSSAAPLHLTLLLRAHHANSRPKLLASRVWCLTSTELR
jgi:hypothetical protein